MQIWQSCVRGRQKGASWLSIHPCGALSYKASALRVLKAKACAEVLGALEKSVSIAAERWRIVESVDAACSRVLWQPWRRWVINVKSKMAQELSVQKRKFMESLEWRIHAVLLVEDAASNAGVVLAELQYSGLEDMGEGDRRMIGERYFIGSEDCLFWGC